MVPFIVISLCYVKNVHSCRFCFFKNRILNNYSNVINSRTAFFNLKKALYISRNGYRMNRAAYKNLGVLFGDEIRKKRRYY